MLARPAKSWKNMGTWRISVAYTQTVLPNKVIFSATLEWNGGAFWQSGLSLGLTSAGTFDSSHHDIGTN